MIIAQVPPFPSAGQIALDSLSNEMIVLLCLRKMWCGGGWMLALGFVLIYGALRLAGEL